MLPNEFLAPYWDDAYTPRRMSDLMLSNPEHRRSLQRMLRLAILVGSAVLACGCIVLLCTALLRSARRQRALKHQGGDASVQDGGGASGDGASNNFIKRGLNRFFGNWASQSRHRHIGQVPAKRRAADIASIAKGKWKRRAEIYCFYDPRSPSQMSQKFSPKDIPLGLCTAVVYCCLGISAKAHNLTSYNYEIDSGPAGMGAVAKTIQRKEPNVKRYVALGGRDTNYVQVMKAMRDKKSRELFADHIKSWLEARRNAFNGILLHILEPDRMPKPDVLDAFIMELSAKVRSRDVLVSLPLGNIAEHRYFHIFSYKKVKYFIKMSHHFPLPTIGSCPNPTRGTRQHSFQKVVSGAKRRHKKNWSTVLKHKVLFTVSLSGYKYTLKNGSFAAVVGERVESYNFSTYADICKKVKNHSWNHKYIGETGCVTAWSGRSYVSSLLPKSFGTLEERTQILGVVVFDIDKDDFRGICGEPYPMMRALDAALNRGR